MDNNEFRENREEQNEALPALSDNSLVALADQVEKRFDAMSKIKRIALKLTNSHDWVDQNGRPYLQASGAEKVARLFGISWRIFEPIFENLEGGHFSYTYKGEFSLSGATIEAIGTRSSKDGFFKKYSYEGDKRKELPVSEIDRGDVQKAAYTNLLGNGITRLLGIRNLTYEDLKEFAGITKDMVTRVEYRERGSPAITSQRNDKPQITAPDAPATEAQQKAIHALLTKSGIKDDLSKHEKVAKILKMKEIPTSFSKLNKGQASQAIEALQQELKQGMMSEGEGES